MRPPTTNPRWREAHLLHLLIDPEACVNRTGTDRPREALRYSSGPGATRPWRVGASATRSHGPQRSQKRVFVGFVEHQPYFLHARRVERLDLGATFVRGADDRHGIDHLVSDQAGGSLAILGLISLPNPVGFRSESDPVHVLVI